MSSSFSQILFFPFSYNSLIWAALSQSLFWRGLYLPILNQNSFSCSHNVPSTPHLCRIYKLFSLFYVICFALHNCFSIFTLQSQNMSTKCPRVCIRKQNRKRKQVFICLLQLGAVERQHYYVDSLDLKRHLKYSQQAKKYLPSLIQHLT